MAIGYNTNRLKIPPNTVLVAENSTIAILAAVAAATLLVTA